MRFLLSTGFIQQMGSFNLAHHSTRQGEDARRGKFPFRVFTRRTTMTTRNLVDPELVAMLDLFPTLALTTET